MILNTYRYIAGALRVHYWVLTLFLFCACFLGSPYARAQNSPDTEKHLYFYHVWGFLKYHHPALAVGNISADSLFLRYLPPLDNASTQKEVNQVLALMLQEVGMPGTPKVTPSLNKTPHAFLLRNLDDRWRTRSRYLNADNRKALQTVFDHRFTDEKHQYTYVRYNPYGGTMPNEPAYEIPKEENVPYALRMLALAKFKAFVDYLYPHKYLMDENWDMVVQDFIPLFSQAGSRQAYETALLGLNARLDDSQAFPFFRQLHYKESIFKNKFYPPFDYKVIDRRIVVTNLIDPELCAKSNIQVNDVLEELDDQPIDVWVSALENVLSVSNRSALWAKVGEWGDNLLFRSADSDTKVLLLRGNDLISVNLQLIDPLQPDKAQLIDQYFKKRLNPVKKKKGLQWIGDSIAYVQINDTERLSEDVQIEDIGKRLDSLFNQIIAAKGLILDLRGTPDNSDFVYEHLYRKFGTADNLFARYYLLNPETPATYSYLARREAYFPTNITPLGAPRPAKVVLLVNGSTQGIGEWLAMNLQHLFPEAITIGQQTAGADGDVKRFYLPGNYVVECTANAVFYPDMTTTQRIGIKINQEVKSTLKAMQEKRDEPLDRAIELINAN
ncbi:S41 family peptidase [Rufibacter roseus]|uniref:S41 family peptidase n=1 Tax=Rufibacter roseus TaxID=1567108 RepID=A0ABW2DPE3_9BACT|nr:S41 family peptidase [Rufibacter roseus]